MISVFSVPSVAKKINMFILSGEKFSSVNPCKSVSKNKFSVSSVSSVAKIKKLFVLCPPSARPRPLAGGLK